MAQGDSQLSNSARLLAAQEFNRRALAKKAAEKLAKIEAERREDEEKRFRRQREALAKSTAGKHANIVAFEKKRLEDDIAKQKASAVEKARIAKLNAQALADKKKAIAKVVGGTGTNIETLSGRVTARDSSGKIIGLTNQESKTAVIAKTRIVREIERREVERTKVTDLERFLQNERALASGQVNRTQLDRQIAERKARGLSKTPQQKRLDQQLRDAESTRGLQARAIKKTVRFGSRGAELTATQAQKDAENKKALGRSRDFTNPNFISVQGGGASFQARAKDNSIGQINSQLALLQKNRTTKSAGQSQNERVALQIASGNFFSGLSDNQLLTITSGQSDPSKRRKAKSAKEARESGSNSIFGGNRDLGNQSIALNQASPFAIIAQQDIPDPTTGITDREVQLFREDLKAKGEPVPDTADFFSSGRAPRSDDPFNSFAFGNFGGEDTTKIKKREQVALGDSIFSDTQTQADIDASRKEANKNSIFGGGFQDISSQLRGTGITQVTPAQQKKRDKRAKGLKAQGITGDFQNTFSVRGGSINLGIKSSLQQSQTKRGGTPVRQPQTFNVNLSESIGIGDRQSSQKTKAKSKTQTKKPSSSNSTRPRPSNQTNVLTPPTNQTQPRQTDFFANVTNVVRGGVDRVDNIFNTGNDSGFQLPRISEALGGSGSGNPFQAPKGVSQDSLNREIAKNLGF